MRPVQKATKGCLCEESRLFNKYFQIEYRDDEAISTISMRLLLPNYFYKNIENSGSQRHYSFLTFLDNTHLSVCVFLFVFTCLIHCSYPEPTSRYSRRNIIYGKASYYGPKFHGKKTANGEIFNQNAMTAAHKSLPFGTLCKVTNRANKKSVIIRINDRGPFVGRRILDLSYQAMKMLDGLGEGVIDVRIEIIKYGDQ